MMNFYSNIIDFIINITMFFCFCEYLFISIITDTDIIKIKEITKLNSKDISDYGIVWRYWCKYWLFIVIKIFRIF